MMTFRCTMLGHFADSTHHNNQGLDFATCHHCGCELIRPLDGEWTKVLKGFRVVWREFGREGDAASVAARMGRIAPPPRRAPRNARPKRRSDKRSAPLRGSSTMIGALASLGKLIGDDAGQDGADIEANGQYVICLPNAGTR